MNTKQIIEYLADAESMDDFINPFVESGQSLVSHTVDELRRIQGLEKLIVNLSVRIAELEAALTTQRNKTEQAFAAGVRHANKKPSLRKAQENERKATRRSKEMTYGQQPRQNPLPEWWEIELRKATK